MDIQELSSWAQKKVATEELSLCAVAFWDPKTIGGSDIATDAGKSLLSGAIGLPGPLLLLSGQSKQVVADCGILAVGERNLFLLRTSSAVVDAEGISPSARDSLRQELTTKLFQMATDSNSCDFVSVEPLDVQLKGSWLEISDAVGTHSITVLAGTQAWQLRESIERIMRVDSY